MTSLNSLVVPLSHLNSNDFFVSHYHFHYPRHVALKKWGAIQTRVVCSETLMQFLALHEYKWNMLSPLRRSHNPLPKTARPTTKVLPSFSTMPPPLIPKKKSTLGELLTILHHHLEIGKARRACLHFFFGALASISLLTKAKRKGKSKKYGIEMWLRLQFEPREQLNFRGLIKDI